MRANQGIGVTLRTVARHRIKILSMVGVLFVCTVARGQNLNVTGIGSFGNIGVGTATPGDKFTAHFGTDLNLGLNTNTYPGLFSHNDAWNAWGNLQLNNSMYLIGSSGNIGIGISSPAGRLHLAQASACWDCGMELSLGTTTWKLLADNDGSMLTIAPNNDYSRAIVNRNGLVGVGTASPNYKLTVAGDVYANGGWFRVSGSNGLYWENYGPGWYVQDGTWLRTYNSASIWANNGTIATNGSLSVGFGGAGAGAGGAIFSGNVGVGTSSPMAKLEVNLVNPSGWSGRTTALRVWAPDNNYYLDMRAYVVAGGNVGYHFSPQGNTGLTLTTPGYVGIGNLYPAVPLDVASSVNQTITNYEYMSQSSVNHYNTSYTATVSGQFAGRVIAPEFNAVSDRREKRILNAVTPEEALQALRGVEVVRYEWLYRGGGHKLGVIAQQLGPHVPEAVSVSAGTINGKRVDDFHTVDYQQLTAVEIAAIQRLDIENAALKRRLAEQEKDLNDLKQEMRALKSQMDAAAGASDL